jgi:hypothetical protein
LEFAEEQRGMGDRLPQSGRHRQVEHVGQQARRDQIHLSRPRQRGATTPRWDSYAITFPKGQTPPVRGFWSLTLYNEGHFFNPNALNRYSLGTKNKTLQYNADGSLTLYAGAKSPGTDKESNWLPAPDGTFSLYIRAYWAEKSILDGTWTPPQVVKVK